MASDTTKKNTTKRATNETVAKKSPAKKSTASTKATKVTKTNASAKKTTTTVKKQTAKTTENKKTATKPKKTTTKTTAKKTTKTSPVKLVKEVEIEDLETREADLNKTVIINPEAIEDLKKEEKELTDLKLETSEDKPKREYSKAVNTILGISLPSGDTPEDKEERLNYYAKDACMFAIIIPILDLFAMLFIDMYKCYPITNSEPINYFLTLLIDFVMIFAITFMIDYIHGERNIKKSKKK